MQVDSDSDAKRDPDADADGEYVDDDTAVMQVDLPAPVRSSPYYPRSSVRPLSFPCGSPVTHLHPREETTLCVFTPGKGGHFSLPATGLRGSG